MEMIRRVPKTSGWSSMLERMRFLAPSGTPHLLPRASRAFSALNYWACVFIRIFVAQFTYSQELSSLTLSDPEQERKRLHKVDVRK